MSALPPPFTCTFLKALYKYTILGLAIIGSHLFSFSAFWDLASSYFIMDPEERL
jgi:hypothetical protein